MERSLDFAYHSNSPPTEVLVSWRAEFYIGLVERVAPEYSEEIVHLRRSQEPLARNLVGTARETDGRPKLQADDSLHLTESGNLLRNLDGKLLPMTHEQAAYILIRGSRHFSL